MFLRVLGPAPVLGFWACLLLAAPAPAGPPLTTIEDVLYKADGSRFTGLVNIAWSSFEASDQSAIATQMTTVKVVNGHLHVQLVPTTASNPEIFYTVTYNSDGLVQFTETWSVPPSASTLRLRDVRVPAPTITGNDTGASGPISESDVTGLIADLSARPLKGPAYSPGAVALVNSQGAVDSVAGNAGDCVHVNGGSAPCGAPQPGFRDADLPAGIIDGANGFFTLSLVPNPAASLALYRNGVLQQPTTDYNLVGSNTVQFTSGNIPQPGDTLLANYRVPSSAGPSQLFAASQILCNGTGATVNTTSFGVLGTCTIPSAILTTGDHLEIKFDLSHQGSAGGFTFQVQWGATTVLQRAAAAADVQVSGHADAGLDQAGAQVSTQSWGTLLPFSATVGNAADAYANGLVITFQGALGSGGDTLTLRNYAVVRLP